MRGRIARVTDEELDWLKGLSFVESRIPKLDALSTFVPIGGERDPVVQDAVQRTGFSRWFPVEGGHRLQVPFEGGGYDSSRFSVEHEAWDHETCKVCRDRVPAMTLCWVTKSGPYVILCEACHADLCA